MSRTLKNTAAAIAYFSGAHAFDALYAFVSNRHSYFAAIGIMFTTLAGVSFLLVRFHAEVKERTGWDALSLERLNRQKDEKKFIGWLMRRRLTIFLLGSCFIGPPVVTILLRKPGSSADSFFYIFSGTLISVVTWVTVWKGFWNIWDLYIQPGLSWFA